MKDEEKLEVLECMLAMVGNQNAEYTKEIERTIRIVRTRMKKQEMKRKKSY